MLNGLRLERPRLYLRPGRISALLDASRTDAFLARLIGALVDGSAGIVPEPPADFRIVGPRMLKQSQTILKRVSSLALACLLTGEERFGRRAVEELLNAAAFPHWNESHFLDTAELCNAFAIGYDWLYPRLTDAERRAIRTAMVEKGLKPGLACHESGAWWTSCHHSWNLVCNGGLLAGALALADEEPELCETIVETALNKLPLAMKTYGPDGGWEAGPDYWEYATQYAVFAIDAMETALGRDDGLSRSPGFSRTGLFPIDCSGNLDLYFNFADSQTVHGPRPVYFWLGRKFSMAECIGENRRLLEKHIQSGGFPDAFDIAWYEPAARDATGQQGRARTYRGIETAFLRSRWKDPEAVFVGFKGGSNQADHAHLDLGSFVFDAFGVRWAADLGPDDYDIPGYWDMKEGGDRWRLFRLANFSHNTPVLNGDLQRSGASASLIRTGTTGSASFAVMDLSGAYLPHAGSVHRGIALFEDGTTVVQDEIAWLGPERRVRWQVMTDAQIALSGSEAVLTQNGRTLTAKIRAPAGARFIELSGHREPPENPNRGFRLLAADHVETGETTTFCVVLQAGSAEVELPPLREWGRG